MFSAHVQVESYLISYILKYSKEQSLELRTWLKTYVHMHMYIILSLSLCLVSVFRTNIAVIIDSIASPLLKATIQLHCPATYLHTYAYSITKQQTELQKTTTSDSQATAECKLQTKKSLKYQISVWR